MLPDDKGIKRDNYCVRDTTSVKPILFMKIDFGWLKACLVFFDNIKSDPGKNRTCI
jgi:hypothetical protein